MIYAMVCVEKQNDWDKSYLSSRKRFVNIDRCVSELLDVICGVPQGSVFGPTPFILYINDICKVSNSVNFILFAADTNIWRQRIRTTLHVN